MRLLIRTFALALGAAVILVFLEMRVPGLSLINLKGRDLFFQVRHKAEPLPPESDSLVLITLDDATLEELDVRWPYPRNFYAQILRHLQPYKPKAVGFDLVFSGADFSAESDSIFATALMDAGNVVVASHKTEKGQVTPQSLVEDSAAAVGIVDKPRDRDRTIRRFYPEKQIAGELEQSWEYEILSIASPGSVQATRGSMIIDYLVKASEFVTIPFWRAFEGKISAKEIENKIVLIGLTSEAFHDIHATPLGTMPGLMVNANGILTLLRGQPFIFIPNGIRWLIQFLSIWLTILVAISSTALVSMLSVVLLGLSFLFVSYYLFTIHIIFDVWFIDFSMLIVLMITLIFREGHLFIENLRLREESSRDPLTGFYSRRFLELKLKSELGKLATRRGGFGGVKEVSVVMIDLDNFKLVNDSFGHAEGDRVLRTMAESIRSSVRKDEIICRFGGDEFCVILSNTPLKDAARFAEKLRQIIANNPNLSYKTAGGVDTIKVTGSIGVASVQGSKAIESGGLLKAADRALYEAKQAGRNRVCVFDPQKSQSAPVK